MHGGKKDNCEDATPARFTGACIVRSFYFPLLTILEPELSDRNLALIIVNVTNKDYSLVLNDIYQVKYNPFDDPELIQSVRSLLDTRGYQTWLEHD